MVISRCDHKWTPFNNEDLRSSDGSDSGKRPTTGAATHYNKIVVNPV
jgi:hypothetical protein